MDMVNGLIASVARVLSHDTFSSRDDASDNSQQPSASHTTNNSSTNSNHGAADDSAMEVDEVTFHWAAEESATLHADHPIVTHPSPTTVAVVINAHAVNQAAVPAAITLDDLALPLPASTFNQCATSPSSLCSSSSKKSSSSSSNSTADDNLTTLLAPSTATGHQSSQAALWSAGYSHARGTCAECDVARQRQQEVLFEQLVTVYECQECNNGESYVTSRANSCEQLSMQQLIKLMAMPMCLSSHNIGPMRVYSV